MPGELAWIKRNGDRRTKRVHRGTEEGRVVGSTVGVKACAWYTEGRNTKRGNVDEAVQGAKRFTGVGVRGWLARRWW